MRPLLVAFSRTLRVLLAAGIFAGAALACQSSVPAQTPPASTPDERTPPPAGQPSPTPVPWTGAPADVLRLVWFYNPPKDGRLDSLRSYFDLFIFGKGDEQQRDALLTLGAGGPILQYLRFDAIQDPGGCGDRPGRNQVADQPGDFCRIRDKNPDWFLLGPSGQRMEYADYYVMDPGSPGWRAFWLERARQSQELLGWQGVFLDNVEASLTKREERGAIPAAYPDDLSYQTAVEGFLQYLYSNYFQPRNRPLYANIISVADWQVWLRYLRYLDGVMDEGFAVDWHDGYLNPDEWEAEMAAVETAQGMGKTVLLVAQGQKFETAREQFALASYLLVNQGRAYFRYTHQDYYDEEWLYSNYQLDLGVPLGQRYQRDGVWYRDFTRGQVVVDPAGETANIQIQP